MEENQNENIIELEDESGKKIEFEFLANITVDEKNYIVLYPVGEEDEEEDGVVILRQVEVSSEDENEYIPIENEEEAEKVFQEFLKNQDEYENSDEE